MSGFQRGSVGVITVLYMYTRFFIGNHFISDLHIKCRNISIDYTSKGKFPKELFNFKHF